MTSDAKNSDLVHVCTLLKKSEEFLYLRNTKAIPIKKRKQKISFYHFSVSTKPVRTKT